MPDENKNLMAVLTENLPKHINVKTARANIALIAAELGISRQFLYRCTKTNTMPSHYVRKLLALDGSTLTAEQLLTFVDLG